MHGILGLVALVIFTTIYFLFPETSQAGARGTDKMKATIGTGSSTSFVFINPFECLWLLRSPSMLLTVRFLCHNVETRKHVTNNIHRVSL